ncbi:unnamed protein product [Boreogadus saida]
MASQCPNVECFGSQGPGGLSHVNNTTPQGENRADVFLRAFSDGLLRSLGNSGDGRAGPAAELWAGGGAGRCQEYPGGPEREARCQAYPMPRGERQASQANGDGQTGDRLEAAAPRHKHQSEVGEREREEEQRGGEGGFSDRPHGLSLKHSVSEQGQRWANASPHKSYSGLRGDVCHLVSPQRRWRQGERACVSVWCGGPLAWAGSARPPAAQARISTSDAERGLDLKVLQNGFGSHGSTERVWISGFYRTGLDFKVLQNGLDLKVLWNGFGSQGSTERAWISRFYRTGLDLRVLQNGLYLKVL